MPRKSLWLSLITVIIVLPIMACGAPLPLYHSEVATPSDEEEIVIYTVLSEEQLDVYLKLFEQEHPDIRVRWERAPTWEMARRILAEKDDPQADVVWGLAATAMLRIEAAGLLEPYEPAGLERINVRMRDRNDPPYWIGHDVWMSAFCVNTVKLEEKGLPMPKSWADLTDPVYKGHLIMPNPNSSGTGFLSVSAWVQLFGEKGAWAYMDALHENIALYTDSGSKPCKLAADGDLAIGISFGSEAVEQRDAGYPIVAVFPEEGSGWEVETVGLIRKPQVKASAKTFVEWAISARAMQAYARFYPVTSMQTDVQLPEGYVKDPIQQLIPNRFLWASANYERIVAKWLNRYENKAESGSYDIPSVFE